MQLLKIACWKTHEKPVTMARVKFSALLQSRPNRFLLPLSLALSLSACSSLGLQAPWDRTPEPDPSLVAENLVDSLTQLPHLNPLMATVQLSRPETRFARQVESELLDRGYKVERVEGEAGLNRVVPSVRKLQTEDGERALYALSVGQVSVERQYEVVGSRTLPASEQIIRGARERRIDVDDTLFDLPENSSLSQVTFQAYEGPDINDMLTPPETTALDWFNRNESAVPIRKNMYETMQSNYLGLFSGYEDVDQSILVFPNDSLRLGEVNKSIIERYVEMMDPETDVLSVIGCSHGKTEISNGNSLLALGRANRVKEALLFSGLEHDRILEEGCWAPQLFDDVMPRRGVVLTLKRQKAS